WAAKSPLSTKPECSLDLRCSHCWAENLLPLPLPLHDHRKEPALIFPDQPLAPSPKRWPARGRERRGAEPPSTPAAGRLPRRFSGNAVAQALPANPATTSSLVRSAQPY